MVSACGRKQGKWRWETLAKTDELSTAIENEDKERWWEHQSGGSTWDPRDSQHWYARAPFQDKIPLFRKTARSEIGIEQYRGSRDSGKTGSRKKRGEARAKNSQKTNYTIFLKPEKL